MLDLTGYAEGNIDIRLEHNAGNADVSRYCHPVFALCNGSATADLRTELCGKGIHHLEILLLGKASTYAYGSFCCGKVYRFALLLAALNEFRRVCGSCEINTLFFCRLALKILKRTTVVSAALLSQRTAAPP